MRLDATKSKEKGLFVSSDPTPCFAFHVHIKTLDCEVSSKVLLDVGAFSLLHVLWIRILQ
jgi:hypothetical protein